MTKKQWLRRCAQRFVDADQREPGEAAVAADACADLEEMTNGNELGLWLAPERAADDEIARWNAMPKPVAPEALA